MPTLDSMNMVVTSKLFIKNIIMLCQHISKTLCIVTNVNVDIGRGRSSALVIQSNAICNRATVLITKLAFLSTPASYRPHQEPNPIT